MTSIAFWNGRYVPVDEVTIGIKDRGLLFADSIYEVVLVISGWPVNLDGHLARIARSMRELKFGGAPGPDAIAGLVRGLIDANNLADGMVYMQVSRGTAARNMTVEPGLKPSVFAYVQPLDMPRPGDSAKVITVATIPDRRWERRDIKATALVANVMARLSAQERGADDAWLVDEAGFVTEGSASNAWIVKNDVISTRPEGDILSGITRERLLVLARDAGMSVEEARFTVQDCLRADEAFITSAVALVTAVRSIDGVPIGAAVPGPVTSRLFDLYVTFMRRTG